MDNPWKDLAIDNGEYVASCDRDALEPFREITDAEYELQLNVPLSRSLEILPPLLSWRCN